MSLLGNIRSRGLRDLLNPDLWKSYIVWLLKLALKKLGASEILIDHWEAEQYVYRGSLCNECVKLGECVHCHCDIKGRISDQNSSCSAGMWGPFLPEEQWEKYKISNKIKIGIKYE